MIASLRSLLDVIVGRFARASGRTLRPTTSGRWIIGLALAVGFAAMNTGNNLLFFGWGLVLSSIVISGILSESTLQAAAPIPLVPGELRANAPATLPVVLENKRRVPAFGVAVSFLLGESADDDGPTTRTGTVFELRLAPGARQVAEVPWSPRARGVHHFRSVRVATAAPFGFFTKERIVRRSSMPAGLRSVLVLPERVDTRSLSKALWARLGDTPAGQAGDGDELFSLRPFREGDDPRKIAWKRAAKTGRLVVREFEANQSREIMVVVRVGTNVAADAAEDAIATAASLIEDLLADGHSVGVIAGEARIAPGRSHRQRLACLGALAGWDTLSGNGSVAHGAAALVVIAVGIVEMSDADVVVAPVARRRPA